MKIKDDFLEKYWTGLVFALIGIPSLILFLNMYPLSQIERIVSLFLASLAFVISIPLGIKLEKKRKTGVEQDKIIIALFIALLSFSVFWLAFNFVTIY